MNFKLYLCTWALNRCCAKFMHAVKLATRTNKKINQMEVYKHCTLIAAMANRISSEYPQLSNELVTDAQKILGNKRCKRLYQHQFKKNATAK